MSWFYESKKDIPTKHNGVMRLSRFFGVWTLFGHDSTYQSSPYVDALWTKVLRYAKRHGLRVRRCLILGVAMGGTFMLVRRRWPGAEIVGVDWEPELYVLGRRIGIVKPDAKMRFIEGDAAAVIPTLDGEFDLIIMDMFDGKKIAGAMTDPALQNVIVSKLSTRGMLAINCFRDHWALAGWTSLLGKPRVMRYVENKMGVFRKK
jgi:spermidine synthase